MYDHFERTHGTKWSRPRYPDCLSEDEYNAQVQKEKEKVEKERELEKLKKDNVRLQEDLSKWQSDAVTSALKGTKVGKAVLKDLLA